MSNLQGIFRIIQSIPSPKAEPFKQWLAKVGQERIDEMLNPELALNRSRDYWQKHGRSEKWIQQRMMGQETRNKLTDYWKSADVAEGKEYAILTNIIHQEWSEFDIIRFGRYYDEALNYYHVDASQSREEWARKGWLHPDDPRGWFQWYCRYTMGRRHADDARQIERWRKMARHVMWLQNACAVGDLHCRPRQRQALLHWAYDSRML
jgi:hypothetical protein